MLNLWPELFRMSQLIWSGLKFPLEIKQNQQPPNTLIYHYEIRRVKVVHCKEFPEANPRDSFLTIEPVNQDPVSSYKACSSKHWGQRDRRGISSRHTSTLFLTSRESSVSVFVQDVTARRFLNQLVFEFPRNSTWWLILWKKNPNSFCKALHISEH